MRPDYAIAADLCEDHGLVVPARVLRQIAEGSGEVFMVRPDQFEYPDGFLRGPFAESSYRTRRLFLEQITADAYAAHLTATLLRDYQYGFLMEPYLFTVPTAEFCRRVSDILGIDYRLPEGDRGGPLIPAWASDEQVQAIAPMFKEQLVEVIRVPLNPQGEA